MKKERSKTFSSGKKLMIVPCDTLQNDSYVFDIDGYSIVGTLINPTFPINEIELTLQTLAQKKISLSKLPTCDIDSVAEIFDKHIFSNRDVKLFDRFLSYFCLTDLQILLPKVLEKLNNYLDGSMQCLVVLLKWVNKTDCFDFIERQWKTINSIVLKHIKNDVDSVVVAHEKSHFLQHFDKLQMETLFCNIISKVNNKQNVVAFIECLEFEEVNKLFTTGHQCEYIFQLCYKTYNIQDGDGLLRTLCNKILEFSQVVNLSAIKNTIRVALLLDIPEKEIEKLSHQSFEIHNTEFKKLKNLALVLQEFEGELKIVLGYKIASLRQKQNLPDLDLTDQESLKVAMPLIAKYVSLYARLEQEMIRKYTQIHNFSDLVGLDLPMFLEKLEDSPVQNDLAKQRKLEKFDVQIAELLLYNKYNKQTDKKSKLENVINLLQVDNFSQLTQNNNELVSILYFYETEFFNGYNLTKKSDIDTSLLEQYCTFTVVNRAPLEIIAQSIIYNNNKVLEFIFNKFPTKLKKHFFLNKENFIKLALVRTEKDVIQEPNIQAFKFLITQMCDLKISKEAYMLADQLSKEETVPLRAGDKLSEIERLKKFNVAQLLEDALGGINNLPEILERIPFNEKMHILNLRINQDLRLIDYFVIHSKETKNYFKELYQLLEICKNQAHVELQMMQVYYDENNEYKGIKAKSKAILEILETEHEVENGFIERNLQEIQNFAVEYKDKFIQIAKSLKHTIKGGSLFERISLLSIRKVNLDLDEIKTLCLTWESWKAVETKAKIQYPNWCKENLIQLAKDSVDTVTKQGSINQILMHACDEDGVPYQNYWFEDQMFL